MSDGDLNELMRQRHRKLEDLLADGEVPYKSKYSRSHQLSEISKKFDSLFPGEKTDEYVRIAGRLMTFREHGKASFADIKDRTGSIQLFLSLNTIGEDLYESFLALDLGDIVGVGGPVFKTKRGELSIMVQEYELLTKSLRPLPEKWHGLKDVETRYRQRYVDLIINRDARDALLKRTKIIKSLRAYLDNNGFLEVETPMLQPIPGGAAARPFITHHEALGMQLYLRIAPELYLKRLIVGDMERVYELNRSFRNEGISVRHNPEFTMLEVYQAYADYRDMMRLCENLIKQAAEQAAGSLNLNYQGEALDLSGNWRKYTMLEAIEKFAGITVSFDSSLEELRAVAKSKDIHIEDHLGKGGIINEIFERLVEPALKEPVFITDYPTEISPLAKKSEKDPNITERFELIIAGLEIGTAFSELTDPLDQRARFADQLTLREAGDREAQMLDEDYIRALEYGMPPAGGLGIGIDRLTMLLTDNHSIREVIAFPHLRPEGT